MRGRLNTLCSPSKGAGMHYLGDLGNEIIIEDEGEVGFNRFSVDQGGASSTVKDSV